MPAVQLDKNSDAKKLAKSCNDQGLVDCYRLPRHLRDEADDVILDYVKSKGRLLFTYDRTIVKEFWQAIVDGCPGVVILAQDDDGTFTKQMTYPEAVRMLEKFKQQFPQWHSVAWANSVVEVKPSFIEVSHVEPSGVVRTTGGFLRRSDFGWPSQLQKLLESNSLRL